MDMRAVFLMRDSEGTTLSVYPDVFSVSEPLMKTVRMNVKLPKAMLNIFAPFGATVVEFQFERVGEGTKETKKVAPGMYIDEIEPIAIYWLHNSPPRGWCWIVHPETRRFYLSRSLQ